MTPAISYAIAGGAVFLAVAVFLFGFSLGYYIGQMSDDEG